MTIQVQAIYKAGAIHLPQPLGLAEGTAIDVTIVPATNSAALQTPSDAGRAMAAILNRLAALEERSIENADVWQREIRSDRTLPGRGE
jgi:hypothetical protein